MYQLPISGTNLKSGAGLSNLIPLPRFIEPGAFIHHTPNPDTYADTRAEAGNWDLSSRGYKRTDHVG